MVQRFESSIFHQVYVPVAQWIERDATNVEVGGSIPLGDAKIIERWCRGLTCLPVTEKITGSNPVRSAKFTLDLFSIYMYSWKL